MFTFKVYYTDGASEVFSVQRYQTRPSLGNQLEVDINDHERFIYVSLEPIRDIALATTSPNTLAPSCSQIDVVYVVNENGKTVDTLGRK